MAILWLTFKLKLKKKKEGFVVKKLVGSTLICFLLLFIVGVDKSLGLKAYAANDELFIEIEEVSSAEAAAYNAIIQDATTILAGDYKVSFCVANNTGFSATGVRFIYDPYYCSPLLSSLDSKPLYIQGLAAYGLNMIVSQNPYDNYVGFATIAPNFNSTANGEVASFFFRLNTGISSSDVSSLITGITMIEWDRQHNEHVQYTLNTSTYEQRMFVCMIGDVDEDGSITAYDAQLLANILSDIGGNNPTISITDTNGYFTWTDGGVTYYFDKLYIVNAGNVNGDSVINTTDASEILQYFSDYVLNGGDLSTYTGLIGTQIPVYVTVAYTNMT